MEFRVDGKDDKDEEEKQKKTKPNNYNVAAIFEAPNLTRNEYKELSLLKQHGKTTTEENYKVEKMFWKDFLATSELDENILKSFMYNTRLLKKVLEPDRHEELQQAG